MFVDAELTIERFELTLPIWLEQHAAGLAHWSAEELHGLRALTEEAETSLVAVRRTSLVHSDLNPKNLIVDRKP